MTHTIHEVSGLFPVEVKDIFSPKTCDELQVFIRNSSGKISFGGGRYSMGGQTAVFGGTQIDMRSLNRIGEFSPKDEFITVEAGVTWRQIQERIDPYNLSVMIMQSYSDFTVGGSLSVNVHGRYIGFGPIILSVLSIKVIRADGSIVIASKDFHSDIFYGVIGGYGGIGLIVEATLKLQINDALERKSFLLPISNYRSSFQKNIGENQNIVFHNADIYPNNYTKVRITNWQRYTPSGNGKAPKDRLIPTSGDYSLHRYIYTLITLFPAGKWIRQYLIDPILFSSQKRHNRNYEASYTVAELEPSSRKKGTYVLQEYFCPVDSFDSFFPKMRSIFQRYGVNVVNISIRHANKDPGSLLAWAKTEVFAFVVYYYQATDSSTTQEVGVWTRELIEAAISVGGSYYLPYQLHGTQDQIQRAYPKFLEFCELKKKYDPDGKFSNALWEKYYFQSPALSSHTSRFHRVNSQIIFHDKIYQFLQNIFHIAPTKQHFQCIQESIANIQDDEGIYNSLQKELPKFQSPLSIITYGIPSLFAQKREMVRQTLLLLAILPKKQFHGYLEIGGAGRYFIPLSRHIQFSGTSYFLLDEPIDFSPVRIFERQRFFPFSHSNILSGSTKDFEGIPDASLELVTLFIGLHHISLENREDFLRTLSQKISQGGYFLLREHDVTTPEFGEFISLVHDIYNAGTHISWEKNKEEIRNFESISTWKSLCQQYGLTCIGGPLYQENDPTQNALLLFIKN